MESEPEPVSSPVGETPQATMRPNARERRIKARKEFFKHLETLPPGTELLGNGTVTIVTNRYLSAPMERVQGVRRLTREEVEPLLNLNSPPAAVNPLVEARAFANGNTQHFSALADNIYVRPDGRLIVFRYQIGNALDESRSDSESRGGAKKKRRLDEKRK
jgi:hypothetical protein